MIGSKYGEFGTEMDRVFWGVVSDYVEREVFPVRRQLDEDKDHTYIDKIKQGIAIDLGIQQSFIPAKYGGLGLWSWVTMGPTCEEMARGDAGIATDVAITAGWGPTAAIHADNEIIFKEVLYPMLGDKAITACVVFTVPYGGCNVESYDARGRAIRTIAKEDGDDYVINGHHIWPSGSGVAEYYVTVCSTDPSKGTDGVAIIYVPKGTPGLTFGPPEEKMGMRYTDVNTEIWYDNVRVPKRWRASEVPGEDWLAFQEIVSLGRFGSAAFCIGVAQACLEIVIDYTGNRYYAGKKVRDHGLQACMIADMAIYIEAGRSYYLNVAQMADDPEQKYGSKDSVDMVARASGAKYFCGQVAEMVPNLAMRLMGAMGYAKQCHVEKYLRDIKIIQLWLGGTELARIDNARGYYEMPPYEKIEPLM